MKKSLKIKQLVKKVCCLTGFVMICVFVANYLTNLEKAEDPESDNHSSFGKTEDPKLDTHSSFEKNQDTDISKNTVTPDKDFSDTADEEIITVYAEESKNSERTTYQTGFYYEPLTDGIKQRITGISYPAGGCTVPYEDLSYVGLLYIDLNGEEQQGELICNKAIAQDIVEIFYELYQNKYQIERIRLIDEYGGDDIASMEDNNTSCFNYRVIDGTTSLSNHAYGLAVDINPFYNPYVVFDRGGAGSVYISPAVSERYADRSQDFACKIDESDLCYRLFIEHGFTWGGSWNSRKDYQHFEKELD